MGTPRHELETGNTGRRAAVVAGLLVALVLALWFIFLRGGGSEEGAFATGDAAPAATEALSEEDAAEAEEEARPRRGRVETFEVFASKDPFQPVVRPGGAGEGGTAEGGAGAGGATASGESGSSEQIGGHRVRLVSVFTRNGAPRAQVQVDSTVFTVREGEVFADNFQLLSISGNCATMLFGDDQFTLCEGEEILK